MVKYLRVTYGYLHRNISQFQKGGNMNIQDLRPAEGAKSSVKRVGRGIGSGMGKTSTRGHKGQWARSGGGVRPGFEGGQTPLARRLPKRGFNNARFNAKALGVNLSSLEKVFDAGAEITVESLAAKGFSDNKRPKIKILAVGNLTKKFTVKVPCSAAAKAKIEAAGGTVA